MKRIILGLSTIVLHFLFSCNQGVQSCDDIELVHGHYFYGKGEVGFAKISISFDNQMTTKQFTDIHKIEVADNIYNTPIFFIQRMIHCLDI